MNQTQVKSVSSGLGLKLQALSSILEIVNGNRPFILQLSDEDAWSCTFCQKEQRGATKKLGLWSCPDILVIHLKRFRQVGKQKVKIEVDLALKGLNLSFLEIIRAAT